MTDILDEAADTLQDLLDRAVEQDKLIAERDAELMRVYEIASIYHLIAEQYLAQVQPKTPEEEQAVKYVEYAVYAVENNVTIDQAALLIAEEETE